MGRHSARGRQWQYKIQPSVLERDDYVCQLQYAGVCTLEATTVDHIIPTSKGGSNEMENLRAACRPCNIKRSNKEDSQTYVDQSWYG